MLRYSYQSYFIQVNLTCSGIMNGVAGTGGRPLWHQWSAVLWSSEDNSVSMSSADCSILTVCTVCTVCDSMWTAKL